MSALSFLTRVIGKKTDGGNWLDPNCTDGSRSIPASGIVGNDGAHFLPAMDDPARPGYVEARTNVRRNTGVSHRAAVTAVDKLATPAAPASATGVTVTGGSLVSATTYGIAVVARNALGATVGSSTTSASPGGSFNAIRVTIAQVAGATDYDIFVTASVTTAMLWAGTISETNRNTGGFKLTAVGAAVAGGGGVGAGTLDVGVVGTGVAVNSAAFASNTAYAWSGLTPIAAAGYSRAHVFVQMTLTDLRALPTLTLIPMFQSQEGSPQYYAGTPIVLTFGGAAGAAFRQDFVLDIDGSTNFFLLCDTISGQGASASVWVELV